MLTFLFWNLNKQPLQDSVARIVRAYDVDVVILAESSLDRAAVLAALNSVGSGGYLFPDSESRKIQLYSRLPSSQVEDYRNKFLAGLNVRRLKVGPAPGILLALFHLPGKPGWQDADQEEAAGELIRAIESVEKEANHDRTLLVGDFNMDPYHQGVSSAYKLHGVMSREIARAGHRIVQKKECRFFYNPMWSCFGDRTPGPPGTFFQREAAPVMHFWHILDQVMVRPALMDALADVRILDSLDNDGNATLLDAAGRPHLSDHLPILFKLDLP